MESRAFYDQYVARQTAVGVNDRHRAILRWLQRSGLHPEHRVLEIGCGVGTLTGLIVEELGPSGRIVATDLSPKSIEAADQRLGPRDGVQLVAGDVFDLEFDGEFDVVVLADVIEHIPLDRHPELFERLAGWVGRDGFVLLNYPEPEYLEWCAVHEPEGLQLIDQPVHADVLLRNAYAAGLHLDHLQTYSVWVREGDYVVAVLRHKRPNRAYTRHPEPVSLRTRAGNVLRRLRLR